MIKLIVVIILGIILGGAVFSGVLGDIDILVDQINASLSFVTPEVLILFTILIIVTVIGIVLSLAD